MEKQSRRQRKKEETRRKILETSFRLFSEKGFENTTVDQIAEGADIGKGTFYNYFTSKEAALFEFMEELGRKRGEKLWPRLLRCEDSRMRLVLLFRMWSSWLEENPQLVRFYVMDRMNLALRTTGTWQPNHFELYLEKILRMGQELGDIRDDAAPQELVCYLNGILLIQLCRWFLDGAGPGLYKLVMDGVDFFLIGALSTEKEERLPI